MDMNLDHNDQNGSKPARIEQDSALLSLPPELRNRIYEYALIDNIKPAVTSTFRPPALIQTCSQIRSETSKMWASQNIFSITIVDCNIHIAARFQNIIRATCGVAPQMSFRMKGKCDWANLMAWCRAVHRGETTWFLAKEDAKGMSAVVSAATKMAGTPGRKMWRAVREDLEGWRKVAGMIDEEWLED